MHEQFKKSLDFAWLVPFDQSVNEKSCIERAYTSGARATCIYLKRAICLHTVTSQEQK